MCFGGGKDPAKPSCTGAATPCPAGTADPIDQAIEIVGKSKFAKTEEGKKVLKKIKELRKNGKIVRKKLGKNTLGQWNGSEIEVPDDATDPEFIASSVLVHEATHALNEDEIPASKTKFTIDEEMRTNTNELDLYEEQRARGYRSAELERRRKARKDGKLRDDVRKRYPGLAEHL